MHSYTFLYRVGSLGILKGGFGGRALVSKPGVSQSRESGVARGLLQGGPLQLPMGWGVGEELTKS